MKTLVLILITTLSFGQISYVPSDEVIANPDRGWSKYTNTEATTYTSLNAQTLASWKNGTDKVTVIYRGFYLPYSTIPQAYLTNMQTDFNTLRASGMKAIVRFGYTKSTSCTSCQPSKEIILSQIEQLAPILNANKDVVLTLQIGFIGAYGEYYYTNSMEFGSGNYTAYTNTQWSNRKEVSDKCLQLIDVPIQLRYPYAKVKMYGNSYVERVGFFNDAFLNIYGDEGFFPIGQFASPSQAQINEVTTQTNYELMCGESNGVNSPRTSGANAITELNLYNWSVLNRDYHPNVLSGWQSDNSFNEVSKRLGYRFVLKSSDFTNYGSTLTASIQIRNDGFANPFKKYNVYLVLNGIKYQINTDIRTWTTELTLNKTIDISTLPNGVYNAYLLIDLDGFTIQTANIGTWTNNMNNLFYSFEKTSLGIKEFSELKIFPNPTIDYIYLPIESQYTIYDLLGKELIKGKGNKIDLSDLTKGVYIAKIKDYKSIKIVKL